MPNLPLRGLGTIGVITDVSAYDLPENAWTAARNIRFQDEAVTRSPIFKPFNTAQDFTSPPILVVDDSLRSTTKVITTLRANGTLTRLSEGLVSNASPSPVIDAPIGNPTHVIAGGVSYINTPNNVPIAYAFGETVYSRIPNWVSTDRCESLRKFKDFLIAINVTKASNSFPNMVKWSDAIQAGTRPRWDPALEDGLAGENTLNDSTGFLVDGMELGSYFMVYGSKEVWRMVYIGGDFVFSSEKVFSDFSIMTQNCVLESNAKHYVFCEDDIVVTDGITKESICDKRVKTHIFGSLDYSKRDRCRVIANTAHGEILFCYPSSSSSAAIEAGDYGCNEAAVFNTTNNTWTFIDLPNVTSGAEAGHPTGSISSAKTWAGLATWNSLKINWNFTTASPMTLILSAENGQSGKKGNVYFYDEDMGGRIDNPADDDVFWPAWCEKRLTDFDSIGLALTDLKLLDEFVPQVTTQDSGQFVNFQFSGDMNNRFESNWKPPQVFNPNTSYKLNPRITGRYISIRMEIPKGVSAKMSGCDLKLSKIASR